MKTLRVSISSRSRDCSTLSIFGKGAIVHGRLWVFMEPQLPGNNTASEALMEFRSKGLQKPPGFRMDLLVRFKGDSHC